MNETTRMRRIFARRVGPVPAPAIEKAEALMTTRLGWPSLCAAALVVQCAVGVGVVSAQDAESDLGWADVAELTLVVTGGNAEASTFGFRNELTRSWESAVFSFDAGALRAESTTVTRSAVGSPTSFQVTTESVSALTAENYYLRGQFDRDVNERTFWYTGGGWERNTFTGVDHRYAGGGGIGTTWVDSDQWTFKTSYGVTMTRQDNVVGQDESFWGVRVGYDYREQITSSAEFTSVLLVDENLKDTGDFRADVMNAIAISLSSRLALKVSWQLLYDAQPSLGAVPLVDTEGVSTGDTVFAELDRVDNFLTFAVVATF